MNIADDAFAVGLEHIELAHFAARQQAPVFRLHHAAQGLNFFAVNGAPCQHHLEAVVILGIVTASDLNAAAAQGVGSEIEHRGGHRTDIDHFDPG